MEMTMDTKTTQRMREHIKTSEGVSEQAYKDTKGKITVGGLPCR